MTERVGPTARRRVLLVATVVCTACLGNLDDGEVDTTTTRYIDTICAENAYQLEGSARRTTGLTQDSCGFALGPEPGRVAFDVGPVSFSSNPYDTSEVTVLLRASDGSFSWETPERGESADEYVVEARGVPLEIVDVRIHEVVSDSVDCSMARYPHRRRSWRR